jgi:DNA topoisomerase-1
LIQPRELGADPKTGEPVSLRKGPFGIYVQSGENPVKVKGKGKGNAKAKDPEKPKRCSLPKGTAVDDVTLEMALVLLSLPREIGKNPDSGSPITAGIGRYGPYVKHGSTYVSIPADESVLDIGLNRAVALIAEAPAKRGGGGKAFADHPADGKPITLHSGRFGPYIKHGRTIASLPKGVEAETLTVDRAVEIIAARAEKGAGKGKSKTTKAKSTKSKSSKAKSSKAKTGISKTAKAKSRKPAARKAAG